MKNFALALLLLCAGCASFDKARDCQQEVGPRPHSSAAAFGVLGALWANQTEEGRAYNKKMDDCMARTTKASP